MYTSNSILTVLSVFYSNQYQINNSHKFIIQITFLTNIVTYLFTLANLSWCLRHKMPFFFFREMYLANAQSGIRRYKNQIGDYKIRKILIKDTKILRRLIRVSQTLFGLDQDLHRVATLDSSHSEECQNLKKSHPHGANGECFICCQN